MTAEAHWSVQASAYIIWPPGRPCSRCTHTEWVHALGDPEGAYTCVHCGAVARGRNRDEARLKVSHGLGDRAGGLSVVYEAGTRVKCVGTIEGKPRRRLVEAPDGQRFEMSIEHLDPPEETVRDKGER